MSKKSAPAATMNGKIPLYRNPQPITPEQHGKLGVRRMQHPFAFAAEAHLVPAIVTEFTACALSYPIIFIGNDAKSPVAVMGLRPGENLYTNETGDFDADAYLPSYVQRYPFVLANEEGSDRMALCIDVDAEMVSEEHDVALFQDGKPSEYTERCMEICKNFELGRQRTANFMKMLEDLDLIETRKAEFTPVNPDGTPGQPQLITEYFAVSEARLNALPAEKLQELRDNGALGQIYAHIHSLLGWDRLIARAMIRAGQRQSAAPANA